MKASRKGLFIFIGILVLSFVIGSTLMQAAFAGGLTLLGLKYLIDSIAPLRWIVKRTTKLIDIIIFAASVMATIKLGVTIALALTIAGLGFTLYLAPSYREQN